MPAQTPYLNVFLSSSGDVAEERALARKIMKRLPNRPTFKGKVALNIIAWDDLDSSTAMEASLTPQAAINKGLPMPSESDIVIVLFWSRMGTPFTDGDGKRYQSGTHWELLNALSASRPQTYIYRRMPAPSISMDDDNFAEKLEQYNRLKDFFASEMFYKDGEIKMSVHQYDTPADFEELFDRNFEEIVSNILARLPENAPKTIVLDKPEIQVAETVDWPEGKSPFPGLRAFTENDTDIFFGRGRETDALVKQVKENRFVAVVGASGSGKSSLVGAGLIPQLRANAIAGSKDWIIVRFTPSENAILSLAESLIRALPTIRLSDILQSPENVLQIIEQALKDMPEWVEVLLFIDQFEELFTLSSKEDQISFAAILAEVAKSKKIRAVVTMRSDFYHRAVVYQTLAELLRTGSFPLSIPKRDGLRQMIERPAERAGLIIEDGLLVRILDDTGDEPGGLALMAYALDELYKLDDDKHLTHDEYEQLGGVQKAIATRAEKIFNDLSGDDDEKEKILFHVFRELLEVDENGTATRRRIQFNPEKETDAVREMIVAFADARLLTTNQSTEGATLEVAHEALLREWGKLSNWIEQRKGDLYLLGQMRRAAQIWDGKGRNRDFLWLGERNQDMLDMLERLNPKLHEVEEAFCRPEVEHLLNELKDINTPHSRRNTISLTFVEKGDTRQGVGCIEVEKGGRIYTVPDIDWIAVPAGKITLENNAEPFDVADFYMARYPITYAQFKPFAESNIYEQERWWQGLTFQYQKQGLSEQNQKFDNHPRDSVSWYQAVAYTRWLDSLLHDLGSLPDLTMQLRLPTEWEWQQAATGGRPENTYPWGSDWDERNANGSNVGIGKTVAVGMYPTGASQQGILDLSGNVREWCLNEYHATEKTAIGGGETRVLRGGSFLDTSNRLCSVYRGNNYRSGNYGFRCVLSIPIHD